MTPQYSTDQFISLYQELERYWLNPDPLALKILFATLISFKLDCDPIWLFLVAPPSSLKTEFISGIANIDTVHALSSLSPQTLVSGLRVKGGKSSSLLERIQSKVLTFKDFTTVLSGRWDDLSKILGQLREVYDGSFVAEFGSGVTVNWKGKITFIAGVTPIIDHHSTVSSMLGERFIQYRLPGVDEEDVAIMAMKQSSNGEYRQNIRDLFFNFYHSLALPTSLSEITVDDQWIIKLASLASFVVRARAGTKRDFKQELEYIPAPEAPARLAKQLIILGKCLTIVNQKKEMGEKEYKIVLKVAFDCIPNQRIITINSLFEQVSIPLSTAEVSQKIGYSTRSTRIFLEDLAAFGLIEVNKKSNQHDWQPTSKLKNYLTKALVDVTHPEAYVKHIFSWFKGKSEYESVYLDEEFQNTF